MPRSTTATQKPSSVCRRHALLVHVSMLWERVRSGHMVDAGGAPPPKKQHGVRESVDERSYLAMAAAIYRNGRARLVPWSGP